MKYTFTLKDIVYTVTSSSINFEESDGGLVIYPEITAKAKDKKVDYELSEIRLYHNSGINTGVKDKKQLIGKRFVWESDTNEHGEEAGFLCVGEHSPINKGVIEILDVKRNSVTIKWSGSADVDWDEKYGEDVPFETEFSAQLSPSVRYLSLYFLKKPTEVLGDTVFEVTDTEELQAAMMEAWKKHKAKEQAFITAKQKFKITHLGKEYQAEISLDNAPVTEDTPLVLKCGEKGKGAVMTITPECPCKIKFDYVWFYISDFNGAGPPVEPHFQAVNITLRVSKR